MKILKRKLKNPFEAKLEKLKKNQNILTKNITNLAIEYAQELMRKKHFISLSFLFTVTEN
jgi:cell division protein FtsB